jgi:hypothetical protein
LYKVNFVLSNFTDCFYGRRSNFIKLVKGLYPRRRSIPASLRNGAAQLIILENNQGQKHFALIYAVAVLKKCADAALIVLRLSVDR